MVKLNLLTKFKNIKKEKITNRVSKKVNNGDNIFSQHKKTIVDAIIPQAINTIPDNHIEIINDVKVYCRTLYVRDLPTSSTFAYTFEKVLKYPNSNATVYIDPIDNGRAISDLNKEINLLETERLEAEKDYNINRHRTMSSKRKEAESLAETIDTGKNKLFKIAIFITLYASDEDTLDKMSADIRALAKNTGIQLASCYNYHDKAFKISSPIGDNDIGYYHIVDRYSLSTLFHYTSRNFSHKKGGLIGRNLNTRKHVFYYLFDESLRAYNALITGVTGSGKSTLLKKILADHMDMGCKVIGLDSDSPDDRGEYAKLAEAYNGINIEIHSNTKTILNPFDVDVEYIYDKELETEVAVLNLLAKIQDVTFILLTMARGNDRNDTSVNRITEEIIKETVKAEYDLCKIYNGQPESLYITDKTLVRGKLTSGKVRKKMPTISSWYERLCAHSKKNSNPTYQYHYDYLIKVMKDWTKEGTRPYFDGQSQYADGTPLRFDTSVPYINLDIHKLHATYERPIAQLICMSKMWEDYIKKNSENPFKAEHIIANFDEVHLIIKNNIYPEARMLLVDMYARIRKKNGGVITSTQEITTFDKYEETKSIITNAETKIIGLQDESLAVRVKDLLGLTDSEINKIISFPQTGMFLLKNRSNKIFIQTDYLDIEKPIMDTNRSILDNMKNNKRRPSA